MWRASWWVYVMRMKQLVLYRWTWTWEEEKRLFGRRANRPSATETSRRGDGMDYYSYQRSIMPRGREGQDHFGRWWCSIHAWWGSRKPDLWPRQIVMGMDRQTGMVGSERRRRGAEEM